MSAFGVKPRYDVIDGYERMRRFGEMSAPWEETFERSIRQNFIDSFGIGTVVREMTLPPLLTDRPVRGETSENYATRLQTFAEKAMSQEDYQASPYFRNAIPWERGMTEDRAAALAANYDQRVVTDYFAQKRPLVGFAGAFVGQAFDPVNYVPIFGQTAHLAAVAKAGSVFGRAGIMSAEASVNTAVFSLLTADMRKKYGQDVSFEAIATEIGMSALIGGVFGTGLGLMMRGADARQKMAIASMQASLDVLENKVDTRAAINQAIHGLATKGVPDIGQSASAPLQRIAAEVVRRSNEPAPVVAAAPDTRAGDVAKPAEMSIIDGYALDDQTRQLMTGDDVMSDGNAGFRTAFLNKMPEAERANFVDKKGDWTPGGQIRLRNAITSYTYGGPDPMSAKVFTASSNPNNMEIVAGMTDAAHAWAQVQRGVKSGSVDPAMDPAPLASKAMALMNKFRAAADQAGWTVAKTMKLGMQDEMIDPATKMLVRSLFKDDDFSVSASRAEVAAIFRNLADLTRLQAMTDDLVNREVLQNVTGEPSDVSLSRSALASLDAGGAGDGTVPVGAVGEGVQGAGGAAEAGAAADQRFVGGLSIQQSAETQGRDFVPTDKDMADLEERLETTAKIGGGIKGLKVASTEGRYGGVERSVDLEANVAPDYDVGPLWRRMLIEAENANQDSVFLAREVTQGQINPLRHRPAMEIKFGSPKNKKELEAELKKLASEGVEFLTVTVGGKPARRGAMPKATGVRIFYMPEFDRRYGMGEDLTKLDDTALSSHMQAKADEMEALVAEVSSKVEGVTGRVGWFDADVAFSGEYRSRLDGDGTGTTEGVGRAAGAEVWAGKSVREGLEGADRQLRFVEERDAAAAGRADQGRPEPSAEEVANPALETWSRVHRGFGTAVPDIFEPPHPRTPADNPAIRSVKRGTKTFDDEYQAELFDLGNTLMEINGVKKGQAMDEEFPRSVRLGAAISETKRLYKVMGNYIDPPARNLGDMARAAMTHADLANTEKGNIVSIIDSDLRVPWEDFIRQEQRGRPQPDFARIANEDQNYVQAKEDPPPDGLAEAEASVGKPETLDETAKAYGVDPENGTFDELDDIKQIKEEGRLTEEDQAELDLAEQQFNEAKAYDKALQAAMRCVI